MVQLMTAGLRSLRQTNTSAVLDFFWDSDVLTVTDIMEATGLARATVHAVCNDLLLAGWVRELAGAVPAGTRVGRPARHFTVDERAGYVLGIDIGDATITAVVADLRGTTVARRQVHNPEPLTVPTRRVRDVSRAVRAVLADAGMSLHDVLAAGVGLAAPVGDDGRIAFGRTDANAYWDSFRIDVRQLRRVLDGVPTLLANDANLAALGERWRGAAQGIGSFITLLAGNRLGAGIIDSGRPIHGHGGGAGEMHFFDQMFPEHGADGIAPLARRWAADAIAVRRRTLLRTMSGDRPDDLTAELVFAAAAAGDTVARGVLDRIADRLAHVIAALASLLNPELVVIGGAVAAAAEVLVGPITTRLAGLTFSPPRVVCSDLGDSIVTVGAVRLALDHVRRTALDLTLPRAAAV